MSEEAMGAEEAERPQGKKKHHLSFPSSYTVLFIVLVLAAVMTYLIPAGGYSKLLYNADSDVFEITSPEGEVTEEPATQETLDKYGIKADLDKFLDGTIYKPMAVSGTYESLPQNGQGIQEFLLFVPQGIADSIDIITFIFMIGGVIGVMNSLGVFNAAMAALARVSHGHEEIMIAVVCFLIAMGGTTFGMAEETIAFYPVMIPVFINAGFDAMVAIAAIWCGSSIGCMFSTVNPFSVVIASNAAGVNFKEGLNFRMIGLAIGLVITIAYIVRYARAVRKDPTKSVIYADKERLEAKFGVKQDENAGKLSLRFKLILVVFFAMFVIMIMGVSQWDWWFDEMSVEFMCGGILIGILGGMNEAEICEKFVGGAADLVSVALVCGLARAVNILLENGLVSDTLLEVMSGWVAGMNPVLFICLMEIIFIILGFFINSSSGLAMLSIPIMAPLADAVGISRAAVISSYLYGLGLIGLITPTGLILASLEVAGVKFDRWMKWCWPLLIIWTVLGMLMLVAEIYL